MLRRNLEMEVRVLRRGESIRAAAPLAQELASSGCTSAQVIFPMFYVQSPDMFTLLQSNFIPQEEALLQVFGNFWYSLLSTWQNFVHTLANFLPVFKFSLL